MQMGIADAALAGVAEQISLLHRKLILIGEQGDRVAAASLLLTFHSLLDRGSKAGKMGIDRGLACVQRLVQNATIAKGRNLNTGEIAVSNGKHLIAGAAPCLYIDAGMKAVFTRLGERRGQHFAGIGGPKIVLAAGRLDQQ